MKIITLLALIIAVGCIMASGCVAQTKKDPGTTTSPTSTFTPFVNATTVPGTNGTFNASNSTNGTRLKGPLRISIGSYSTDQPLPVLIDNQTVGTVTPGSTLDLMVNEGNRTVAVCVGIICGEKYINIQFAKRSYLDFEDILKKKAEFSKPVVRILKSYKFGQGVTVDLEFINPTSKAIRMSAEVSSGYTYIDDRTNVRMGDSIRVKTSEWVEPGTRMTRTVSLYFSDGSAYSYDEPVLGEITLK